MEEQRKLSNRYQKILVYSLQIVVVGLLCWYLVQNRDSFALLKNIRWEHIAWIILLDTLSYIAGSFINYSMIHRLDPKVGFLDCLMLQYVNSFLNKILPTIGGGAAFRGYYLKKVYNFPYTQFASTIAGLYVISFTTTSLIGIVCLLVIYWQFHVFNWLIFLAFAGILAPMLIVILFTPTIPNKNHHRLLGILGNIIVSWNTIKRDLRLVFLYMGLSILLLLLSAGYSYIGYQALGVEPSLIAMLYLSTLGIIMAFLNFTPDGIGVKEGIYIFSKDLVQIPQDVLVLGSMYLRGISILTTLLISAVSYWALLRRLRKATAAGQIPVMEQ